MAEPLPAAEHGPDLARRLEEAYAARDPGYVPRTHHLAPDGRARFVNRLILEPSPYLLQHAHNPVDWRAWSAETLAEAQAADRPIFLSIGYATCHWCHVMEEESFDDEEVAAALNAGFIPVKIDREQRPDLDHIFITATQLQQGHAGWPNSLWLMPDGRPFHTGTYFPKHDFLRLLAGVRQAWETRRAEVERVAAQIAEAVGRLSARQGAEGTGGHGMELAHDGNIHAGLVAKLREMHNAEEGGFSQSQQFPQEGFLIYLLDHWQRTGDETAGAIARRTLDAIAAGGIHDQIGGGFHRYTVDPNWRTPHFEKMLYNQGQLARAFVQGWEATGEPGWRRAALHCFAYVLRDMTEEDGAFFAAEDADSLDAEGRREEGAFYAWTPAEAAAALTVEAPGAQPPLDPEEAGWVVSTLGLEEPPTIEAGAVPHLRRGMAVDFARLDPALERLRVAREARARPFRDDKVIAGWNGLMIRALAEGAMAFGREDLAHAAARAAESLWARLWDGRRLARLWAGGAALEAGLLEDYAWLGLGCMALADATGETRWLGRAEALADAAVEAFADPSGRLRMSEAEGPLGPVFDSADGATPSGESSMAELLACLARRRSDPRHRAAAERLMDALAPTLAEMPLLRPDMLVAMRILAEGESGARQVAAGGVLRARLADGQVHLDIAENWHVNSADPGVEGLLAARADGAEVDWPAGREIEAGFADRPVRVYDGRVALPLRPREPVVTLHLQPCSESFCGEPVAFRFRVA